VEAIKPLFPAVYGPDVYVDLDGESADHELDSVLKQALFQLQNADKSEAAVASAIATLVISDDPVNVSVDMRGVSEAVEEQLKVRVGSVAVLELLLLPAKQRDSGRFSCGHKSCRHADLADMSLVHCVVLMQPNAACRPWWTDGRARGCRWQRSGRRMMTPPSALPQSAACVRRWKCRCSSCASAKQAWRCALLPHLD
jgi:hypothetical protein